MYTEKQKLWYKQKSNNKDWVEKRNEYAKKWWKKKIQNDPEWTLKKREYQKKYRLENKEKLKISNKLYKQKNKEKINAQARIYRKNKRKNDPVFAEKERNRLLIVLQNYESKSKLRKRFKIFKRDNFTCQYCGAKSPDVVLEIDHKIPKSKGGSSYPSNLITACFECNRGKSNIV